jgi:hypothetical protein
MRQILACALMFVIASSIFFVVGKERQREEKGGAQATDSKQANDQVKVKTDRFSGVTTVKLKPQVILGKPDHQMTIEIETKLGEKGQLDFEKDDLKAEAWFRSQSKDPVDFGDQELHFLIDNKPLDLGKTPGGTNTYKDKSTLKAGFRSSKSFVSILDRSDLAQFSNAKHIEMRLGSIELTLDKPEVAILREYANQVLAQHKIVIDKKQ